MDNKSINTYPYRYFQVYITGERSYSRGLELIPQRRLEMALYGLVIKDRKSCIGLENFNGQLERDSLGGISLWRRVE